MENIVLQNSEIVTVLIIGANKTANPYGRNKSGKNKFLDIKY
jgi:hypothetical protein